MIPAAIAELVDAILLAWVGRYYWTHAEDFCRRGLEYSQRIRQPWRSLLYPHWFWGTRYGVFQMRLTGIGGFVMAGLLLLVAVLTISSGHR
jgi:hypothetical protein